MPTPNTTSPPPPNELVRPAAVAPDRAPPPRAAQLSPPRSSLGILVSLSVCHLLNDSIQALIPALYPLIKESFHLNFTQIGFITLAFQMVGSVLQPIVGFYTDRHPKPFSTAYGMGITLCGLILLALAPSYPIVVIAAALVGVGSAIFHPESSRMARHASGGQHGLAQSLFQVGGNGGTAIGPLLAAGVILPYGQKHILWFSSIAVLALFILAKVGAWYRDELAHAHRSGAKSTLAAPRLSNVQVTIALTVLLILMFAKFFYIASMTNYYTFFLMQRFPISASAAQVQLCIFLVAGAVGTFVGGPLGDRIGRKRIIWVSILGAAPFTLLLPHANLFWGAWLLVLIGLIKASAFPAILVYATELFPAKVGLIAGLFFGLAFGLAGIGSAVLGALADATSIAFVMQLCAYLPLLGLFVAFLPNLGRNQSVQPRMETNQHE